MAASRLLERDLRSEFDQFVRYVMSPEAAPAFGPVEQQRGPGYDVLTKVAISGAGRAVR